MSDYRPPLDDIRERDAQTEASPAGGGTKYAHQRRSRSSYHRDGYTIAAGDRHVLLELLRECREGTGVVPVAAGGLPARGAGAELTALEDPPDA